MNTMTANGFFLDPSSAKFTCPECNENTFVRYVNEDGEYLPDEVGRCDREINCCYHYKAYEYFRDNKQKINDVKLEKIKKATEFYEILSEEIFTRRKILKEQVNFDSCENNFVRYLIDILGFDPDKIRRQMLKYNIFIFQVKKQYIEDDYITTESYNNYLRSINRTNQKVQYFYVSRADYDIRTARELLYNKNFHREKDSGLLIHYQMEDYDEHKRVKWCMFGEHLLTDLTDKRDIIIVEAEKTAFVMSLYYPEFNWVSVGGLNGISEDFDFCRPDVINYFMPDSDVDTKGVSCAEKWRRKIPRTIYCQTPYNVIDFDKCCSPDEISQGFDILDLQFKSPEKVKSLLSSLSYFMRLE